VYREKGQFGSIVLRVAQRELRHLRGDAVVEVPLSPELQAQLVKDGVALGLASSRGS
jgi:Luciferase